ncbi:MAG: DUF192 domain-containing protein [Pseudomonadota bacterium]
MKLKHWSILVGLVLMFTIGCEKADLFPETQEPAATEETATLPTPSAELSAGTVVIHGADKDLNLTVELANDRESRAKGLSGREALAPNSGMLFIFEEDVRDAFWTKDTYVPLDLIFIDSAKNIVDIIVNAEPNSTERLVPNADYRYVLEVPAGYANANAIEVGNLVELRIGPR